jgi:hypothetical protein
LWIGIAVKHGHAGFQSAEFCTSITVTQDSPTRRAQAPLDNSVNLAAAYRRNGTTFVGNNLNFGSTSVVPLM